MKPTFCLWAALCLFTPGCDSGSSQREASAAREREARTELAVQKQSAAQLQADVAALRKTAARIESYATDLESKLGHTSAETWTQDAAAARRMVGNLLIEIEALQRGIRAAGQTR